MEKISVIVPAYNAEKTIGKCLETLVNQTYENMEIIVIDDGSKDNTLKIMKKYQKKHPDKVVIISRENKGIGYTRNEGIKIATGKYLGFVDSDDYVEVEMFEHLYNHLKKTKADIVVSDYYEFDELNRREKKIIDFDVTNIETFPDLINEINTAPWNKLYKKSIFKNIKYPENLKYEDLSTVLLALLKANKISKLNEPLYDYYINMNGESNTFNYRILDLLEVLNIAKEGFPKNKEMNKAFLQLSFSKIFPYVEAMYNTNDQELMFKYLDAGILYLNKNFKFWRIKYIIESSNIKNFVVRVMQTMPALYKIFIKIKLRNNK